jgi:hypothetical protein
MVKFLPTNFSGLGENFTALKAHCLLSQISASTFYRARAQRRIEELSGVTIAIENTEGEMAPLADEEVRNCAAVIAAAFLNPGRQNQ